MKRVVQILVGLFFLFAGVMHFVVDDAFARIVPPVLPYPYEIVWITGVMELVFAALLIAGRYLVWTGRILSVFLLCVLPANIYMAIAQIPLGDETPDPVLLWVRVAMQFPFIALILWATGGWASASPRDQSA